MNIFSLFSHQKNKTHNVNTATFINDPLPHKSVIVPSQEVIEDTLTQNEAQPPKGAVKNDPLTKEWRNHRYICSLAPLYPKNYSEYVDKMNLLESQYPNQAKLVSIGEIKPGLSLHALKLSSNINETKDDKPIIVITGLIHACEWDTGMTTLRTAELLLQGYENNPSTKERLKEADILFIPVLNPEGYDYSRSVNPEWRKNRNGTGIDINRNFYDPKNPEFYRVAGDTPETFKDDIGGSDNADNQCYRGPSGASEAETKLLQDFFSNTPNILGVLDHHSGDVKILYPYAYKKRTAENKKEYLRAANKIQNISDVSYKIEPLHKLYLSTGSMMDFLHAHGIFAMAIEIGKSFHPYWRDLSKELKRVPNMDLGFIDFVLENTQKLQKNKDRVTAKNANF